MSQLIGTLILRFDASSAALRDGLSVVQQIGQTLWVANDETTHLERFTVRDAAPGEAILCSEQTSFSLDSYLKLPLPNTDVEVDIEGLAYDKDSQYLWIVGSHSLKRTKARAGRTAQENVQRLSTVEADGNRFVLARIPVIDEQDGSCTLAGREASDGRTAAILKGDSVGNALTSEIAKDKQLRDFLQIPGKDNGFDIEGLAVIGSRLLIGLRGPVLRGWSVMLEVEPVLDDDATDTLKLKKIGPDGQRYRKHLFALNGLGVRDLCTDGNDLLILAGPTMDLDGPVTVFRWRDGFPLSEQSVVFNEQLETLFEVPFGKGEDHAEGMCIFKAASLGQTGLLIVYDAAATSRKLGISDVLGDVYSLP
ncbi:hypothetical protein D3C76_204700 [compost metagenome]